MNPRIKAAIMGIFALLAGLIYFVWGLSDILSVMGGPRELLIIVPAIVIIIFFVVIGVLVVVSIVLKRRNIPKLDIKDKNLFNVEKWLLTYLEENKGKAFSARALHKRCVEENNLDIRVTEIEKILNDLHFLGNIRSSVKENVNHYFVS